MAIAWYEKVKHGIRYWLLRRLPTCKRTVEVISQSFERPLSLLERLMLKLHLWICIWCVWYLEHLQTMRTTLRSRSEEPVDLPNSPTLSAEARERIKRALTDG